MHLGLFSAHFVRVLARHDERAAGLAGRGDGVRPARSDGQGEIGDSSGLGLKSQPVPTA